MGKEKSNKQDWHNQLAQFSQQMKNNMSAEEKMKMQKEEEEKRRRKIELNKRKNIYTNF